MNETARKFPYTFVHQDGTIWFDLTYKVKEYNDLLIRNKYGGNKGIHKTNINEQRDIQEMSYLGGVSWDGSSIC